ncbi:hypothetical protein CHS0354_004856 [Potamilus streckersoni]|uniref:Prostaglandin reductase 1 n=1 Tax=Potamilus streckersoni TaxID=2493646 RepID=A0AAE0VRQ3_9BIVA|nr:hypothetical protein CHS0354_004856 [Potamilus streckersoni]
MKGKKWILDSKFEGEPSPRNFKLVEEDIDENLNSGEVLCEAVYLSVDPYMRVFVNDVKDVMKGEQVAIVVQSKHPDFGVGSLVLGNFGWRSLTKVSDISEIRPIPELGELSPSLALGSLGMPGLTAYYGVLDVLKVKVGETFVVTAAAGAVGSFAGQVAKLKGCKVIGFAGSKEKCDLIKEYGFDYAFNYKEVTLQEAMATAAPEGVDCYFDNVGGTFTNDILPFMKTKGRIAVCGSISTYGMDHVQPTGRLPYYTINQKTLTVQAFLVYHYFAKWPAALNEMIPWVKEGKIKYRETIMHGFDKMVDAFIGLFKGTNIGKAVVKC